MRVANQTHHKNMMQVGSHSDYNQIVSINFDSNRISSEKKHLPGFE